MRSNVEAVSSFCGGKLRRQGKTTLRVTSSAKNPRPPLIPNEVRRYWFQRIGTKASNIF
jgi:hypothetical protein